MLLPVLFIRGDLLVQYTFVALFGFFHFAFVRYWQEKAEGHAVRIEDLRSERERLAKGLADNREYLRVSEYMSKLEERNRLSQAIHDGIGHSMTGALIQLEAAKRLLVSDPETAGRLLQNAIDISKEGIEEIRVTLKNTKPPAEQLGLVRLKAAAEAFGARTGLLVTLVHEGEMEILSPRQWKVIHENVLEALTNCGKYAQASAVHVEVRVLNRFIQAVVADNGQGAAKWAKGLGLIGMEERAAALNGTVVCDGTRGFRVTTLLPRSVPEEQPG
ncbi:histidine kinase [Paenibacillus sp. CC-CFT747]|nr:histidine kinase [Paenibacillus sp. CC-CFT747]